MLDALISGGMKLIGGFFDNDSAEKRNDAIIRDKAEDRALQREFAQSGIQWRVADAKKAGIHPLAALGGSGASYTPSAISLDGGGSMSSAFAGAGQDIGRAINATRSAGDRADAFSKSMQTLTLEKAGLENEMLKSQIARLRQTPNPPMPIGQRFLVDGQGQTASGPVASLNNLVNETAMKRVNSDPAKPYQEPGAVSDVGYARTSGGLMPIPSADVKERIEDNFIQEIMHAARNNVLPAISPMFNRPPYEAPKGQAWVYDPMYGYKLVRDTRTNRFFRANIN